MGALDLFVDWHVTTLRLETPGMGDYVVRETRAGTYDAEVRLAPGMSWECVGEGYRTALEAVSACERDLSARTGGAL